jgi:hypothetical protein
MIDVIVCEQLAESRDVVRTEGRREAVDQRAGVIRGLSQAGPGESDPPTESRRRSVSGVPSPLSERLLAQEVEIAAAVGLQDFAAVEAGVAALGFGR